MSTVLGINPPPTDQTWTGMAYEEGTGIGEKFADNVSIYPNPAKDVINISFETNEILVYDISIINQFGQNVYSSKGNHTNRKWKTKLDISSMPAGLYYVVVTTSSNQVYQSSFEVIR